ncbi:MAG: hypothetical protein H6622_15430 [Halobacteriovoraceae bacterium]|nr:hypothetical protein [Halobacteriovoraceae bacterium]
MKAKKIAYIGKDKSYWTTIQHRFSESYKQFEFEFVQLVGKDPKFYQDIFLKIFAFKPDIIFLDLSENTNYQKKLATMISTENSMKHVSTVGLVDTKEAADEIGLTGLQFIHVKCGEYHDVVYDPFIFRWPKAAKKTEFARARFQHQVNLIERLRIGYITKECVHIETNLDLEIGDTVVLETKIPEKINKSKYFKVKKKSIENLYYNFKYNYDLELTFLDRPDVEKKDESGIRIYGEKEAKHILNEYENELPIYKKRMKDWVQDNLDDRNEKSMKILIIDKELKFMEGQEKPLDEFSFTIRFQSFLSQELYEIEQIRPNILAIEFWETNEEESQDDDKKNMAQAPRKLDKEEIPGDDRSPVDLLSQIISKVKSMQDYRPFVILFNCKRFSSASFQDSYRYPFIMANQKPMTLGLVTDMSELYRTKQDAKEKTLIQQKIQLLKKTDPQKYRNITANDFKEDRFYIKKSLPLSICKFSHTITINSLTETELVFTSKVVLQSTRFEMRFPIDMFICTIPIEGQPYKKESGGFMYRALIYGVDETAKKKLRQYVNEIFFSSLNEERQKEQKAFEDLNRQAMENIKQSGQSDDDPEKESA